MLQCCLQLATVKPMGKKTKHPLLCRPDHLGVLDDSQFSVLSRAS